MLTGSDVLVGHQCQCQLLPLGADLKGRVTDLKGGQGIGFVHALDNDDRDVGVGRHVRRDRDLDDIAVAAQGDHLGVQDVPALDGQQRLGFTLERGGDQDRGSFAWSIAVLVGDQLDAIVVLDAPAHIFAAADPHPGGALHLVAFFVLAHSAHHIAAARGGFKAADRLACTIRGQRVGEHGGVAVGPGPVQATTTVLLAHAVPGALVKGDGQVLVRPRVAVPVHGAHVHVQRFAHLAHVALRVQAGIELALVHHDAGAPADDLVVQVRHCGLEGKALAGRAVGNVGWHGKDQPALGVGLGFTVGDQLAKAAIIDLAITGAVGAAAVPIVTTRAAPTEGIVAGQQAPAHLGVGHRAAEKVAGLHDHVDAVAV